MIDWIALLNGTAFPIVVSLWFMLRTEKIIQANTMATLELSEYVRHSNEKINN